MIKFVEQQLRNPSVIAFLIFCAGCFSLSIFRCVASGTGTFLFLNWNLFLAGLPLLFSRILLHNARPETEGGRNKITKGKVLLLLPLWMLFFPNAPYILTDLFHLGNVASMPKWFDLLLILSFAWAGLFAGFKSLQDIQGMLEKFVSQRKAMIVISLLLFTAAFGVYIGRFERWSSWDLIVHPYSVAGDVLEKFTNPLSHLRTWGVTLFLGTLLNVIWFSIRLMRSDSLAPLTPQRGEL